MYRDLAATTMPYAPEDTEDPYGIPTGRIDDWQPFHDLYPDPTRQVSDFREFEKELDNKMDEEYFDLALREGVCPFCDETLDENLDCPSCGRLYVPQGKSFSIAATTR